MHLTINRAALSRAITAAGRAVESRNTVPILSNLLLAATDDGLTVTGTDLDVVVTIQAEADVRAPGAVCVDAKLLGDISKKAGADDVLLSLEDDKLIVKSGRSRFALQTLPAIDFPTMGAATYAATFDIDLAALFAPVQFAISSEETRYYLNGIFFHGTEAGVIAVATDGHRLSRHVSAPVGAFAGVIVPRKTVGLLPKGVVTVQVSDTKIRIQADGFELISKLIDGTFPDYQRVIPANNERIVTVDRDAMMKAADRVASISSEKGKAVKLSVAPGGIVLSARSEVGAAEDEVAVEYSGEPFDIGFNSAYLRDLFTVLPAGPVVMKLTENGPGLVESPAFEGLTMVVMPMRV
jgi:DNA polymerase-3 subunit beta